MHKYSLLFLVISLFSCLEAKNDSEHFTTVKYSLPKQPVLKKSKKNIEIVFCLDATGSMSGLIGTAKEKIWEIVSSLVQQNDSVNLKLGMIFYRDQGDEFVTKQIALSGNLDEVYADLLSMEANGGGDTPESVNRALSEAILQMQWSSNHKETYKSVFLVGDCPPHMDYQDDVLYTETCEKASENKIIINTIKLGNSCESAIFHFKKIAELGNGNYLHLDQNASDKVISTPYDNQITEVSKKIDQSRLYYGQKEEQTISNYNKSKSLEIYNKSTVTANSARADYKLSKSGEKTWLGTKELINDYNLDKVKVVELQESELPVELQGKSLAEKEIMLQNLSKEREGNLLKLKELGELRAAYIMKEFQNKPAADSLLFSKEVIKVMLEQSKRDH